MNPKLTVDHLRRPASVYVRQSSPDQVLHPQESIRRQHALSDQARALGFQSVVVLDEDLGRTGSGWVECPGLQRLVAEVCGGEVGVTLLGHGFNTLAQFLSDRPRILQFRIE
jgi:DNA invertase Pin-like site-specific DNA recombinase